MVMALVVIILTLLLQILIPMGRGTRRGAQQIELQQVAQVAMDRLLSDLSGTPRAGITLSPDGRTFSLQQVTGVTATGKQEWDQKLIVYRYDPDARQLTRREWPPIPPDLGRLPDKASLFTPSSAELSQLSSGSRVLAGEVEAFELDSAALPARVRLALRSKMGETFELTRELKLRNVRY